ncbi:four-carbon acid sugar kinase family protein [Planctomycetaceae bacterium SH139]
MSIVVIADDLTGAAEIAGAALRFGMSAEVQVGRVYGAHADVIVVDADSRSLSAQDAAVTLGELTRQALAFRPSLLFKKVDSILRGHVLDEIMAMQSVAQLDRCLLVNANPRKGRTVVDGRILIAGEPLHRTVFALDPEHPCNSNRVIDLLTDQKHSSLANTAANFPGKVRVINPGESTVAAVSLGNANCSADLEAYAQHWRLENSTTLAAGGAEFFEAVLNVIRSERAQPVDSFVFGVSVGLSSFASGDSLLISGSLLGDCGGWPLVSFAASQHTDDCAASVCETLATHGRAAILASDLVHGAPLDRLRRISDIASRVLASCRPSQVWIEGGRTASLLIRDLGYERLLATGNVGDGVVALKALDESSPLYLVKPGSYPWTVCPEPATSTTTPNRIQEVAS